MKRALLILTPAERAIFSARAATDDVHQSRLHPTGASLLGWAARALYNELGATRAWHIFHSGAVRFSDALPLVHSGHVAFPAPKILMSLKGGEPVVSEGGRLEADRIWVDRKAFKNANPTGQGEGLKRGFLTDQLEVFNPPSGGRLRTATEEGRAKRQALFGSSHLEPVTIVAGNAQAAPVRYAATIEGDLTGEEWERLRAVFTREPLRLGRAAATSYGGWYACEWSDSSDYLDYWQEQPFRGEIARGDKPVRVWLLSDLAVFDSNGTPCFDPAPERLGLPAGGELIGTESVTETRRYAPWNGALNVRDVERQVIAAGSVLSYRYHEPIPADLLMPLTAGLFQEQGLGRLWVDPPLLRGKKPAAAEADEAVPPAARAGATVFSHPGESEPPPSAIAKWAQTMAGRAKTQGRDALRDRWIKELDDLLRRTDKDGPSPSQWKEAANAGRGARDLADIVMRLFDSPNAVCGSAQQRTRGGDWLAGTPPVRDWLRRRLEEAQDKPVDHIRWALDQLARDRAQGLRAGKEERRHGCGVMGKVLHLVRATIEALSPLSTASGDGHMYDVALVRDANGLPEIAASSIQGVLRHLHEERYGEEKTEPLFGFEKKGDDGQTARLFFSFGRVHGADNVAVTGLRIEETPGSMADELLQRLAAEAPLARDHVALNHRHVADGRGKFERVAVPRGTRFSFEIAMWGDTDKENEDAKALHNLLSLMKHPAFRLGGATRRGYGRVALIAAGKVMPLSNPAAIRDVRRLPASDFSANPFKPVDVVHDLTPADGDAVTIALTLKPTGLWRFGSTGLALRTDEHELRSDRWIEERGGPDPRGKDVDAASVREPWIDWSGNRGYWREPQRGVGEPLQKITLAGTAIKGPLAHRTLFHWNRLHPGDDGTAAGRMLDPSTWENEPPAARKDIIAKIVASKLDRKPGGEPPWTARPSELENLFGSVKETEGAPATAGGANSRSHGSAARLIVDDADIDVKPENIMALDHNSLDRFTGGVRNRLLFSEEVAFGGEIAVTITILPPRDDEGAVLPSDRWPRTLRRAFCHALRDLCEGRLALGAKSLGFCKAETPAFQGNGAEGWKTAWDEAGAPAGQGQGGQAQ